MFFQPNTQVYIDQLERSRGSGICFILDGYDKFSNSRGDQSVIHQLIHKTYLPLAMVILTSRPAAIATLHPEATTILESVGFTKNCFEEFVDCYLVQCTPEKDRSDVVKTHFKEYLKACSNVLNICYPPLNASIICFLFDYLREAKKTPKTESDTTTSYKLLLFVN